MTKHASVAPVPAASPSAAPASAVSTSAAPAPADIPSHPHEHFGHALARFGRKRTCEHFVLKAPFTPKGDQEPAIAALTKGVLKDHARAQTLLGVTGSGKTFTMANLIARTNKTTLIIEPNKTLAAQVASEMKEFFPDNAVVYFVSYYDYYQPEAYIPQTDTYIEKDSSVNEEVEKLRHQATSSLLSRSDCIVVASVSCIYGIGSPEDYAGLAPNIDKETPLERDTLIKNLIDMQYQRSDLDLTRGCFRVRGDSVDVFCPYAENPLRIVFFGDEVEEIAEIDALDSHVLREFSAIPIWPASHYVVARPKLNDAIKEIGADMSARVQDLKAHNMLLEAERLSERCTYDLEMLETMGFCSGIENYSRYMDGRAPGEAPYTLIDYFPADMLCIIDESHVTVPQIRGMYEGDRSRKTTLVEHGFRLPSALDNRPLRFDEFEARIPQFVYVSATPGDYELSVSTPAIEQIIRPTGLLDPRVDVRPTLDCIADLTREIRLRIRRHEKVLVCTLTKRSAEDLVDHLLDEGLKVNYMHSDTPTLERIDIISDLRKGVIDVLVGINLLREGLDIPEVSLVAILDADKEGFLRNRRSLIQTMGRAARNAHGAVIMYADKVTDSMQEAISETARRRHIQETYNHKHHIEPQTIQKSLINVGTFIEEAHQTLDSKKRDHGVFYTPSEEVGPSADTTTPAPAEQGSASISIEDMPPEVLAQYEKKLQEEMAEASAALDFDRAARARNQLVEIEELRGNVSEDVALLRLKRSFAKHTRSQTKPRRH